MLNGKSERWRGAIKAYAPLFLWIGVIFYLSSDQGSMSHTSRFVRPLLEFLFPAATEETLEIYHGYVRKAAHLTEYAVLGLLALRAFSRVFISNRARYIMALALGVAVAAGDELNQSFLVSRSGSAWDTLLDISGVVAMISIIWLVRYRSKTKNGGRY